MKKIAIIGGGISGLTIAQLLKHNFDVQVFEADARPGGMIKCDIINGCLFHRTGGHVFNTKRQDVSNWFWNQFNRDSEFTKTLRNASIILSNGESIPYPIENYIYLLDKDTQRAIIADLISIAKTNYKETSNFEEFLKNKFGNTLYKLYFQSYNYKIWRRDLTNVPLSWLDGKLPMPSVLDIIHNNISHIKEETFVHSSFYYPINGGSQFLANRLSSEINIAYNNKIDKIFLNKENKWEVGEFVADIVIFCGNLNQLPSLFQNQVDISKYANSIQQLEYHGTTTVFCEIERNDFSWIYLPSNEYEAHRIICTGNFAKSNNAQNKMTATIEFTDYISKNKIIEQLKKLPYNPKYLAHHFEKYTYPIQDTKTRNMISSLSNLLNNRNFYLLGRFAEWEYYNMDAAIGSAIDLSKRILSNN